MKKIYICGLVSSGKGVLRSLFDGHPQIINYHFDFGATLLMDSFRTFLFNSKRIELLDILGNVNIRTISINYDGKNVELTIGQLLSFLYRNDQLRDLIDVSTTGKINGPSVEIVEDYNFCYTDFMKTLIDSLLIIQRFSSVEHLQDTIYECAIRNSNCMTMKGIDNSYFLQSSINGYPIIEKILKFNDNRKIIIIERDSVAQSFSNTGKLTYQFNNKSFMKFKINPYDYALYSQGFINKVKKFKEDIHKLAKNESDVCIIKFEELILNTKETMNDLADFLEIERNDILYTPTVNSKSFKNTNIQLIGKIIDDPQKKLPSSKIDLLKYFYGGDEPKYTIFNNFKLFCRAQFWKTLRILDRWQLKVKKIYGIILQ